MFIFSVVHAFLVPLAKTARLSRLSIPLLYAMIVSTILSGWFYSHYDLAYGIWCAMLGAVALSWVVTII